MNSDEPIHVSAPLEPILIPAESAFRGVERPPPPSSTTRPRTALLLFAATCLSTFLVGGPVYAGLVMAILLAHEMGHYLQAVRYRIPASLPYFIPFPISPFGTMGAVIVQGSGTANRRQLFDIAVTGPLAGLVFALPIAWYGVLTSEVVVIPPGRRGLEFGEPLLLQWMIAAVHGLLRDGQVVEMNGTLMAGWFGLFLTALNLVPIGQLDGGHILYSMIGRRAHTVALVLLAVAVGYMAYTGYYGFSLMIVLLILMGPRHPPTANDAAPLGLARHVVGWLSLSFLIIGFTPMPISLVE